jgi:plasmid stabilization system protein ParE
MARIIKRAAAVRDLTYIFVWPAEQAGVETGRRFLRSAEKAFRELAAMPRMAPLKITEGKFAGLRMWRVPGFESTLIFYRPLRGGVAIERVFHARRDYERILK